MEVVVFASSSSVLPRQGDGVLQRWIFEGVRKPDMFFRPMHAAMLEDFQKKFQMLQMDKTIKIQSQFLILCWSTLSLSQEQIWTGRVKSTISTQYMVRENKMFQLKGFGGEVREIPK